MKLSDPVEKLDGVGPANAKKLSKLGIFNLSDLLYHFPFRYDDFSKITPIGQTKPGGIYTIKAQIVKKNLKRIFKRHISILEILVKDETGSLVIVWFNQPYLQEILQQNRTYLFSGQIGFRGSLQMQNPVWELFKPQTLHTGRVVPVYPLTAGIYPKWLRTELKKLLGLTPKIAEYLPKEIVGKYQLPSFDYALRAIHFPKNIEDAERARSRLAFDELLFFQIRVFLHKKLLKRQAAHPLPFKKELAQDFISKLPFPLTQSQKKAAWEISQDLDQPRPANRLLAGDVGSGKTVVAAMAAAQCLDNGYKAAIMVPTEILAAQHFNTFSNFPLISNYVIGLITSSACKIFFRNRIEEVKKSVFIKKLSAGEIDLVIGTHALIQKNLNLSDLVLVIVDEQHRFGVQQRAELQKNSKKKFLPHFLSLTATPIPRTLALTLYGHLDISRIDVLPSGRKKIITKIVLPETRKTTYLAVEEQVKNGRQVFVVCPLIDPSDSLGVKSATEEFEKIKTEVFPKMRIGLLHGRLKPAEKENVIEKFRSRELDILVATTVVEVGVDFPNASVMMIEGAERFGLSQLHQLRGRVGRSEHQSYCYLLPENLTDKAKQRLEAMETCSNGLELSEIDLKLRGPGEVYGSLQSGYSQFKIANIFDTTTLENAREAANLIITELDSKNYPLLAKKLKDLQSNLHPE